MGRGKTVFFFFFVVFKLIIRGHKTALRAETFMGSDVEKEPGEEKKQRVGYSVINNRQSPLTEHRQRSLAPETQIGKKRNEKLKYFFC